MTKKKTPPPIKTVENIKIPKPVIHHLDNGIPVYEINMGTQDILKLEVIFDAGRWHEDKQMVARLTSGLLKEGTQRSSAREIAEKIDYFGGSLRFPSNLDSSHTVLYCLTKHFDSLLPEMEDIIKNPSFPEEEIRAFIDRRKKRLLIDQEKNDIVAYRYVTELMFGEEHPYGYNSHIEGYDNISRSDIIEHFEKYYTSNNCKIMVSGKVTPHIINRLNEAFGALPEGTKKSYQYNVYPHRKRVHHIHSKNELQCAIRIGRRLFNRNHPDFMGMYLVNTILGGYFGSRLMQNLREDKGYTYGIYSSLDPMRFDGYFYIGAEVGSQVKQQALQEIYKEIKRLREELVGEEELHMVRNYLLGTLLSALDGPFHVAEVVKTMVADNLPFEFFDKMVNKVKTIQPEEIRALAQKYLQKEDLYEVVVG